MFRDNLTAFSRSAVNCELFLFLKSQHTKCYYFNTLSHQISSVERNSVPTTKPRTTEAFRNMEVKIHSSYIAAQLPVPTALILMKKSSKLTWWRKEICNCRESNTGRRSIPPIFTDSYPSRHVISAHAQPFISPTFISSCRNVLFLLQYLWGETLCNRRCIISTSHAIFEIPNVVSVLCCGQCCVFILNFLFRWIINIIERKFGPK